MKTLVLPLLLLAAVPLMAQKSLPFKSRPQEIPGRIECEFYNTGGEGVAYHDKDSINNGSGKLNPANGSLLNEFRMKEGVDISYTKGDDIDNTNYNTVSQDLYQFYVGWTEPGEWLKYDVLVTKEGIYNLAIMYTANGDGVIGIDVDDKEVEAIKIPSTADPADKVDWRQWHHWNRVDGIGRIVLTAGRHVITLRTVDHGQMNFDFIEFIKE